MARKQDYRRGMIHSKESELLEGQGAAPGPEGKWLRDLRDWIERLRAVDELKVVSVKVTPDGEIQEIARQMSARKGPAVLFTNISGHEKTWCQKLFVGSMNTFGKVSVALGLPKDAPPPVIVEKIRETMRKPTPPKIVDTGPVKDNIIKTGIDLNKIPVPMWHPGDGGRYINTWHGVVTKDPETGALNVGCYRGMIKDKDTIVSLLIRSQQWGQHFVRYSKRGEKMPVAFVYGGDPTFMIAAGSPVTTSGKWAEYDWMGTMQGEPVPLVLCETVDLYVPANAEIIIEGHVLPDALAKEGPFKEASGQYAKQAMRPVMKVSCITHRNDPIFTGSATGLAPILEEQFIPAIFGLTAVLKNHLDNSGLPFTDLTLFPFFAVKIQKMWQGHPLQVAYAILGHKSSNLPFKMLVVVDDNVNIYDPNEVIRAINNNVDPAEDVHVLPVHNLIFDAAMAEKDTDIEEYGASLGNKLFIDATVNWKRHPRQKEWGGARMQPAEPAPAADVEKVKKRWAEYGFEK